jgi:alkanesulfonate monooxygenase SsuD/methylene tetrahydromethanopterin reductase-like flavin-dependent oxidoreductase (luciferase family)
MDRGRALEFGISVVPDAASLDRTRAMVHAADESGLDLIGIQDHPYQWRFLDTWMLIGSLLAETRKVRIFPDVANLPLRHPALLAKEAATLDVLSGGRFELGLGAGAFWDAIEAMGGPRRAPGEAIEALEEAIAIIRLAWSGVRSVRFDGTHYRVHGYHPGPSPAHPIELWLGAYRPRMLRLTGRLADGWIPSLGQVGIDQIGAMQGPIDDAARKAGRDPAQVRRMLNLRGAIGRVEAEDGGMGGEVDEWVETLSGWATEIGLDTFILWPVVPDEQQVEEFGSQVAPRVREEVERRRDSKSGETWTPGT